MSSQTPYPPEEPAAGSAETGAVGEVQLKGRTLPPPWGGLSGPLSVTTLTLEQQRPGLPVPRRKGPNAELGMLEAQLRAAESEGDLEAERRAAMSLSRALAARGAELDAVTKLARRALVLGDDASLRTELSTWFAGLGEPALAAATLRPMLAERSGLALSRLLTRIAVLLARAGDAAGAAEALREATTHGESDPLPPELLGAVGAWAPDSLPAESAALAYVEGSRRRLASGEKAAAFEDLLRAFEAAPQCAEAADALYRELTGRGRAGAADEVLREHARALLDEQARLVHVRRMRFAIAQGEHHRGVAAGLDARLDADFDLERAIGWAIGADTDPTSAGFETLLDEVGLHDLLAVRLDVAADTLEGSARARARSAVARLYGAKLGRPTRAVQGWLDAVVCDPGHDEAWKGLRAHAAQTMDFAPLVEGLIRVTERCAEHSAWASAVQELLRLAEERLSDPGLAAWAARRLVEHSSDHAEARQALERLAPRVRLQNEALKSAQDQQKSGPAAVQVLSRLANILLGRPEAVSETLPILAQLVELSPGQARWRQQYRLLLERAGEWSKLDDLLDELAHDAHSPEKEALILERVRVARVRGDFDRALALLKPWLTDTNTHTEVSALALVLATRQGDNRARAQALVRTAAPLRPSLRATLMSLAVEALLAAGDHEEALELAEAACHVDPSRTRPVAARAFAVANAPHVDHAALERAVGVVVPRTNICSAIAQAYENEGSALLSLAWTQRQLALRPGDLAVAEVLLDRVIKAGDAIRLSDALAWLLSQPEPLARLAEPISRALEALAKLDPDRSTAIARRALDVLGPKSEVLRQAILEVADTVGERGLAIAVIERWLASGAPADLRGQVLLTVAQRRKDAGDADGAARALRRALDEGVSPRDVARALEEFPNPRGSDGILALLEVRARVQSALGTESPEALSETWREVGAARWDLAHDSTRAFQAWEHAAILLPEGGYSKLAADLLTFAGPELALTEFERLAAEQQETTERARILSVAAGVALEAGRLGAALDIGARALALDPSRTDVLAIVERSARQEDIAALDAVYLGLAKRALGIYGMRAAHYRAARQMEQRKQLDRAFSHALKAFEAVPTEGVAFVMLTRLVQSLDNRDEIVRALERVAQESPDRTQRSRWLKRAAMFADESVSGARQRLEVLLRALAVSPDLETLSALGDALGGVLRGAPEDRDILELRYDRALGSLLKHAMGYNGALILVRGAQIALTDLEALASAHRALKSAMRCDPGVDAYAELKPSAARLAEDVEASRQLVDEVLALAREEFSGVGAELLELAGAMAEAMARQHDAARLYVAAAERRPENRPLVRKAEHLAHQVGDQELLDQVLKAVPARERLAGLLDIARECRSTGQLRQAIDALKRANEIAGLDADEHAEVQEALADAYRNAGHNTDLESLLQSRLEKDDLTPDTRVQLSVELAALIGAGGEPERALRVLAPIARERQDRGLLGDMAALAEQAGDKRAHAEALDMMVDREHDPADRLQLLKQLADLLEQLGDEETALARYREVLELNPNDPEALVAAERDAERRGDFEALVKILARRAALAPMVEDVRRIHLHRAMVLEQRLARPEDARRELEALVAATGDNLSVLRVLADLNQRLSDPGRAASLWLRASAIAKDRNEAAELAFKSCEAQLSAGDVAAARRVLEGVESWAQNLRWRQLKVEVERLSEDPFALGHAIEEMALASDDGPEVRAALLVEAAQTALAAGDSKEAARRAEIAARLAPGDPNAQLLKHTLGYRRRGVGDAEKSRLIVAELRGLEGELSEAQEELRGFLLGEALDVSLEPGAGLLELERLTSRIGPRPLLALGIAERAFAAGDYQRSQHFFERALAGDLQDLRKESEVRLQAAEAARALGHHELALALAEAAASDAAVRPRVADLIDDVRRKLAESQAVLAASGDAAAMTRRSTGTPRAPREPSESSRPPPVEVTQTTAAAARSLAETLKSEIPDELLSVLKDAAQARAAKDAGAKDAGAKDAGATHAEATSDVASPRAPSGPSVRDSAQPGIRSDSEPWPARGGDTLDMAPLPPRPRAEAAADSGAPPVATVADAPPTQVEPLRNEPGAPKTESAPPLTEGDDGPDSSLGRTVVEVPRPRLQSTPDFDAPPVVVEDASSPDSSERLVRGLPVPSIPAEESPDDLADAVPDSPAPRPIFDSAPPDSGSVVRTFDAGYEISGVIESPYSTPAPDEADLLRRFKGGDESAAHELITRLEGRPQRTQDLVSVCRRLAKMKPADAWVLQRLRDAAAQDGNYPYANAVAHVMGLFEGYEAGPDAPPLRDQPELPDAVKAMLFRNNLGPGGEALRIVWEGASHVFRRDPSTYGVTGLERVPLGAPTVLGRVYSEAARAMGVTRTPMFQRRSAGSVTMSLALLTPPALILSGEVAQDSLALRYHIGSMLAAAWPEHVLLFGAGEAPVRAVLQALLIAFGPPRTGKNPQSVANLAEVLWESIPASAQRQLRQLCDDPNLLAYDAVVTTARGVQRRSGLFVCGDFGLSLRQVLQQEGLGTELPRSLEQLAVLARQNPAVIDLLNLATSPEYAEVRWQSAKPGRAG